MYEIKHFCFDNKIQGVLCLRITAITDLWISHMRLYSCNHTYEHACKYIHTHTSDREWDPSIFNKLPFIGKLYYV